MALLTRVIFTYGLDLTIPISQINENMKRAHHRDSVRQEKFYFRVGDETNLMSIDEIMNGSKTFPGLVALVQKYLNEHEHINSDTRVTVEQYMALISKRAAGILSLFSHFLSH
jgi:glutamate--cysteine ligase catalytic subunit